MKDALRFDFSNIKGDFFGGLTAGIVAIPVSIAFGVASGLGAEAGLYGAIAVGIIAALFGGTPTQVSGPTGPMTVVAIILIGQAAEKEGSMESALPLIILTFFLAGLVQLILGSLKIGKYINYIPDPVVSGFMNGIGVIIVVLQLRDFTGSSVMAKGVLENLQAIPQMINDANMLSIGLACVTMAIIYLFPLLTKAIPSTLVALIICTTTTYFMKWDVPVIGEIPAGLPVPQFGVLKDLHWENVGIILIPAFSLGALGVIDSLLTSVVADKMTKTKHKSDREIIGQGLGNMFSALVGGLPGAGSTMRTVTNIKSGGRTKISGVIHGIFLVLVIMFGTEIVALIPKAVLAGILITVGISLPDLTSVKSMKKTPLPDSAVMVVVMVLTVFWDLMYAVLIGLMLASLFFMKKMADVVELGSSDTKIDRLINQIISTFDDEDVFRRQVYVKNFKGPIFFGFASRFQKSIENLPDIKAIIFNLSEVPYMDQSGLNTFKEAILDLNNKNINVCISEANEETMMLLENADIIPALVDDGHIFESVEECVMWLNEPGHVDNIVESSDELYIPSAYTPNGDGINDEWQLRNIDQYPECTVKIFNSDGKQIFYSEGYREMWEGFYNGRTLPSDAYFYEIDLNNDGSDVRKGKVSIFR